MFAYKEIITVDDPQHITLGKPLPLPKGKKIEVLIIAEEQDDDLETVRDYLEQQGITESMVAEAVDWARK
ncbi:MAG: hypothetical protein ACU84H_15325 [Gammaproteobacteria bacterium]